MSSTAAKNAESPDAGAGRQPLGDASPPGGYDRAADPRWARVAHRAGGLVLFALLLGFVMVSALLRTSPDAFNSAMAVVQEPVSVFALVLVAGGALFHLMNAVRFALVDLTRWGAARPGPLLSVISALWWAFMAAAAYLITQTTLLDMFGNP